MSPIFENYREEIANLFSLSKKNNNYVSFVIEHGNIIDIVYFNNNLETCCFDIVQNLNLNIISSEGHIIQGKSDKLYLPDVISRLYSSLENLLKANVNHKVNNKIDKDSLKLDLNAHVKFEDFNEWDIDYLKEICERVHREIADDLKEKFLIKVELVGKYSLCHSGDTNIEPFNYDDFKLELKCSMYSKENAENKYKFISEISYEDLLNKSFEILNISNKINDSQLK